MISNVLKLILLLCIMHRVEVGSIADVSEINAALVFRVDVNRTSELCMPVQRKDSGVKSTSRMMKS
jgi:hypothetical protein